MQLSEIEWLPIDQYEYDGSTVLLRWHHGYTMIGSAKSGRASRDGMPLDGREFGRIEGRLPIMFARLPLTKKVHIDRNGMIRQ